MLDIGYRLVISWPDLKSRTLIGVDAVATHLRRSPYATNWFDTMELKYLYVSTVGNPTLNINTAPVIYVERLPSLGGPRLQQALPSEALLLPGVCLYAYTRQIKQVDKGQELDTNVNTGGPWEAWALDICVPVPKTTHIISTKMAQLGFLPWQPWPFQSPHHKYRSGKVGAENHQQDSPKAEESRLALAAQSSSSWRSWHNKQDQSSAQRQAADGQAPIWCRSTSNWCEVDH